MMNKVQTLNPDHLAMLCEGSAICEEVILARGYRTVDNPGELAELGFGTGQRRRGLLMPLHTTDGRNSLCVLRPDCPRERRNKDTGVTKVLKYELPAGCAVRLDCPPICQPMLKDPGVTLWVTEGQKKADALASKGACSIALLGVWNFKGRNSFGGTTFLADWDHVALDGRSVRIVFDSDIMTKAPVRAALERLTEHLQRKGAHVTAVYLPNGPNGQKMGVDDFFAKGHTLADVEALVEATRPAPTAAPARVELLDEAPLMIRRPLCLLQGRSYAAIWPYCKVTLTESADRNGQIMVHNPPLVTTNQRQLLVRDDGVIFGEGGDHPLSDCGAEVALPEVPSSDKLWAAKAVKRYKNGYRPDPPEVFRRVVEVIDRFIDFDRSLADQHTMCELVACYILATWLLDAFTVIGFLWPNGDRGTGKTQLLNVVCELGYLGQVILAGGSYAALRDLADYGACLGFDDAENLGDARKTDPDKRALLLAGNRKGSTVTLKEIGPDKVWRTRHVNTFCPRLFSAIKVPDPVLASRSIVIPLVRTGDSYKVNADPKDYKDWPHDPRVLVDDLWALAVSNLPEVGSFEKAACDKARIAGRNLEPWRAVLTVARWLDTKSDTGLYARIEGLSHAYQAEKIDLESTDLSVLTIKALRFLMAEAITSGAGRLAGAQDEVQPRNTCDAWNAWNTMMQTACKTIAPLLPAEISKEVADILLEEGHSSEGVTSDKIGRVMRKLRFKPGKETTSKRRRLWKVSKTEVCQLSRAYGLCSALPRSTSVPSGTSVPCVTRGLGGKGSG
jgi:hypothetical protein